MCKPLYFCFHSGTSKQLHHEFVPTLQIKRCLWVRWLCLTDIPCELWPRWSSSSPTLWSQYYTSQGAIAICWRNQKKTLNAGGPHVTEEKWIGNSSFSVFSHKYKSDWAMWLTRRLLKFWNDGQNPTARKGEETKELDWYGVWTLLKPGRLSKFVTLISLYPVKCYQDVEPKSRTSSDFFAKEC